MGALTWALLLSLGAGGTIFLGAFAATREDLIADWLELELRHTVIAFGGGALLAAVSLVLVPDGAREFSAVAATGLFAAGGVAFMWLDRALAQHGGAADQLIAMLLDFIPEATALGASLVSGDSSGYLLALLIGMQNLPEGFNAYREIRQTGEIRERLLLCAFAGLPLLGPLSAWVGATWLSDQPRTLGAILLFSAGGILYLVFQDIAPQGRIERHWWPAQGAVAGFALGLAGHLLVG